MMLKVTSSTGSVIAPNILGADCLTSIEIFKFELTSEIFQLSLVIVEQLKMDLLPVNSPFKTVENSFSV